MLTKVLWVCGPVRWREMGADVAGGRWWGADVRNVAECDGPQAVMRVMTGHDGL